LTGKNSWNLPSALLEDTVYLDKVRNFWIGWKNRKHSFHSVFDWWEEGKTRIKSLSISYTHKTSIASRKHETSLDKRLRNAIAGEIRKVRQKRAHSHFAYRNHRWAEEGEKCTSFFLNAHKNQVRADTVSRVRTSHGITSDNSEILNQFSKFYESLYTETPTSGEAQLKLTPEQSTDCSRPFTLTDLKTALTASENGKCPGLDGIPVEFYKALWPDIGPDLFDIFNQAQDTGILPESMRQKGDLTEVRNWRPISLLNADYKIFAKCIANRFAKYLPFVVSPNQTANVHSRKISHNLSMLRDFVFHADTQQLEAFILSIDQMKAFDRVNWDFLISVLKTQNFPPLLLGWVRTLYTDISSCVRINGFTSLLFAITRGVRQGCPLSAILYTLFSEALNRCIICEPDIHGPAILDRKPLISQYADDTCIGAIGDSSIFSIFRSLSGAKINPDKSRGLWLGANRGRIDRPQGVQWTSDSLTVLGIPIGTDTPPVDFWLSILDSAQRRVNNYSKRDLSLKGRVVVIKQLLLPLFVYPSFVLVCPSHIIRRLQQTLDSFLWNGKSPKVPKHILELPVSKGGLAYPNVERMFQSIRLSWTKELFASETDGSWKVLAKNILSSYNDQPSLSENIFKLSLFKSRISASTLPNFYKAWLKDWVDLDVVDDRPRPKQAQQIRSEPLFGNRFITNSDGNPIKRPRSLQQSSGTLSLVGDLTYHPAKPSLKNMMRIYLLKKLLKSQDKCPETGKTPYQNQTLQIPKAL